MERTLGFPLVAVGSRMFSYMSGQVIDIDYGMTGKWEVDTVLGVPTPM
jgi:hypothetical protein